MLWLISLERWGHAHVDQQNTHSIRYPLYGGLYNSGRKPGIRVRHIYRTS